MKKIMAVIATSAVFTTGVTLAADTIQSEQDKVSYSMGYKTGEAMKARHVDVNTTLFAKGLDEGYTGKKPVLSEDEMQASLQNMQKKMIANMQAKYKKAAGENNAEGKAFLEKNAKEKGVVTTSSGLQYKVVKAGKGTSPTLNDTVTVNYEGKLINGTVFDSSYKNGKPVTFKVNQVIKGWQEALTKMKPGATWMLYIPADLAYGQQGSMGKIGPNETLIFKVDLLSVSK